MAKHIKRPAESFTYVLVGDRDLPADQQTEFLLRPMTVGEYAAAQDDIARTVVAVDGTRTVIQRGRQAGVAVALAHIVEVRNFPVGSAQPWPKDSVERERYLSQMLPEDVQEIAAATFRRSRLGDEEKNSSTPGLTSSSGANSAESSSTTAPSAASSPT
jgi:hypothetical protein